MPIAEEFTDEGKVKITDKITIWVGKNEVDTEVVKIIQSWHSGQKREFFWLANSQIRFYL